ncbi:MAG: glycosyltransferase family 2 protein [Planctomycetaceae bacterium]
MSVSVVVPIYNEVQNLRRQYDALMAVLPRLGRDYEIIFVDDGSDDGSARELARLADEDERVKLIEFRGNFGQSAAMSAGIAAATGEIIVTMDGDLQNDPADIPLLLARIDEGYDLAHGWRKDRQDALLTRRLPSLAANWIISKVTRFPVHDLGCTLKAIRRDVARELELYGEMHRFIPILAAWRGARCVEVVARHHPRRFGTSKYGLSRTLRVLLDLITVRFLVQYLSNPMRLFGAMGLACGSVAVGSGLATVGMKWFGRTDMTGNPLLLLAVFSAMVAVQFFALGMLGELGARIYFQTQNARPYAIRRRVNFDHADIIEARPAPRRILWRAA